MNSIAHVEKDILDFALNKFEEQTKKQFILKDKTLSNQNGDAHLHLVSEDKEYEFLGEIKSKVDTKTLEAIIYQLQQAKKSTPLILISNYVSPKIGEQLRNASIFYLDTAGNAFIDLNGLFVLIEGKSTGIVKTKPQRAFSEAGVKLIFYLLNQPELLNVSQRELAEKTELGLGSVNIILKSLKELKYIFSINKGQTIILDYKKLLDRWVIAYAETLRAKLRPQKCKIVKVERWKDWLESTHPEIYWGGERAGDLLTDYLSPELFTIYTSLPRMEVIKEAGLIPYPQGKVEILDTFWNTNIPPEKNCVPPVLVYADLILSGDRRNQKTAERVYEEYLSNKAI